MIELQATCPRCYTEYSYWGLGDEEWRCDRCGCVLELEEVQENS